MFQLFPYANVPDWDARRWEQQGRHRASHSRGQGDPLLPVRAVQDPGHDERCCRSDIATGGERNALSSAILPRYVR